MRSMRVYSLVEECTLQTGVQKRGDGCAEAEDT